MPNQMPFNFNYPNMNNFNPLEMYQNKINELEQRLSVLEKKVKELTKESYQNSSFDYKTSMHMM